jgi:hypothetical protein
MLQGFVSSAFVVGTLLTALMPGAGLARDRDDHSRDWRGGSRYSGGRSFASPRGYYGRGYIAPRSYGRPVYRGRYNGGFYLGYGAPYGYAYDPGYVYDPGYAYQPPPPQNYGPNQQQYQQQYPEPQYQQPQRNYDPNQQQYQEPQYQQQYPQQQYQQPQGYRR